jgi:hypothetical protein
LKAVATMAALALVASCDGASDISIGASTAPTFYLGPAGSDDNPGTQALPWRTFAKALPRLLPGRTLVLLDGTYTPADAGRLEIRCGTNANSGTASAPVTLRAQNQRAAFLRGDGNAPPFFMEGCSYWNVDGVRAESADSPQAPDTPDAGSVFLLGGANHNVTLTHLLGAHPNRYKHSHGLRIPDGSSDVIVEECELYSFHHNAFETARTSGVVFRRNYMHSRATPDVPGGYVSDDPTRGDIGVLFDETRSGVAENNIVESIQTGVAVLGRYEMLPSNMPPPVDNPTDGNKVLGNVVLFPSANGYRIDSRCVSAPCMDPPRIVTNASLTDDVVVGGLAAGESTGAVGTTISKLTAIFAATGVSIAVSPPNVGFPASSSTDDTLVTGYQAAGFSSMGENMWGFDHCAAAGAGGPPFLPADAHVTSPVTVDTKLGACLVSLPLGSPLRGAGAGGSDVGASVVDRYQDGLLTNEPLWNATTGAFPCGAVIPGVNDDPTQSCIGVNERLHVGAAGCPL